jgi:UDPglucose--hexose-1-phosphate uridylyltransferase
MNESEIRQNKATKQWVIYAPYREKRPRDFSTRKRRKRLPVIDKDCPFCPGNENKLPPIIMETHGKNRYKWQTRVVPNKYPSLMPHGDTSRFTQGIYVTMKGYGRHEVIIESPFHNQHINEMSNEDIHMIIETYHKRYVDLMKEHDNMMTIIFRNHGILAGTSLLHPHSQIIVTEIVPIHIRWREEVAQRFYDEWGRCVYCDILEFEIKNRQRIIMENESFLAFIPFAAEVPFELWILPKKHNADFGSISDKEKEDFSIILRETLERLYGKLNDPDYNYIINTSSKYRSDEPQLHWYLQIRPRLITQAGFEIGSGISINPSMPEEDAIFLNK